MKIARVCGIVGVVGILLVIVLQAFDDLHSYGALRYHLIYIVGPIMIGPTLVALKRKSN